MEIYKEPIDMKRTTLKKIAILISMTTAGIFMMFVPALPVSAKTQLNVREIFRVQSDFSCRKILLFGHSFDVIWVRFFHVLLKRPYTSLPFVHPCNICL